MQVLQHIDPTGLSIVARQPRNGTEAIHLGSQLIVEEGEWAVFLENGEALDLFGPGQHTLDTANLPLLTKLIGIPLEGGSAFQAAVAFVSAKTFDDLKWGTKQPVIYRDRELGLVPLRAFGTFAIRVAETKLFLDNLAANQDLYATDAIESYLRDIIVAHLSDVLADELGSILDLPDLRRELSGRLGTRVAADLARHGLELEDLFVGAIMPPRPVQKVIDEGAGMAVIGTGSETYLQFKAAPAAANAAEPAGAAPQPVACPECGEATVVGGAFCAFCGARLMG